MTTASLPLAPLYQRGARVRQADANVRAADADARAVSQSLSSEAAHAYYRVALAQVAVDAADDVSNWLDSLVVYNRSRVQQGALAEADLMRTELERIARVPRAACRQRSSRMHARHWLRTWASPRCGRCPCAWWSTRCRCECLPMLSRNAIA
jgi:outer membrane protein TolC